MAEEPKKPIFNALPPLSLKAAKNALMPFVDEPDYLQRALLEIRQMAMPSKAAREWAYKYTRQACSELDAWNKKEREKRVAAEAVRAGALAHTIQRDVDAILAPASFRLGPINADTAPNMLCCADEELIPLTPEFIAALEAVIRAELAMWRAHDAKHALWYTWGECVIDDLMTTNGIHFSFGGDEDHPTEWTGDVHVSVEYAATPVQVIEGAGLMNTFEVIVRTGHYKETYIMGGSRLTLKQAHDAALKEARHNEKELEEEYKKDHEISIVESVKEIFVSLRLVPYTAEKSEEKD